MFRQRREDSGPAGEGPNSHSGTREPVQAHLCPTKGTRTLHSHSLGRRPKFFCVFVVGVFEWMIPTEAARSIKGMGTTPVA